MSEPDRSAPDHDAAANTEEGQAAAEDTSDVGTDPEEDPEAQ